MTQTTPALERCKAGGQTGGAAVTAERTETAVVAPTVRKFNQKYKFQNLYIYSTYTHT